MARKFFYVCAGMLMLALSYHFGANTAAAQAPGNACVGFAFGVSTPFGGTEVVLTANGDVYASSVGNSTQWVRIDNVFSGPPTPALHESWGQVKARYHNTPGMTVTPGGNDR